MSWIGRLLRPGRYDRRADDELRFHLDQQVADYIAAGMPPAEARRRAMVEFGGVIQTREACADSRGTGVIDAFVQDVRYSARMLGKHPGWTLVVVLSLALGLGANAVVFGVARAVVLRDLAFPHPDRLVRLYEVDPQGGEWPLSHPDLGDVLAETQVMTSAAGFEPFRRALSANGAAMPVAGAVVTPGFFQATGVPAVAGRTFGGPGVLPREPGVAVVTRGLAATLFGAAANAPGKTVVLDGASYVVVGVIGDVADVLPGAQVLVPFVPAPDADRDNRDLETIGRLKATASPTQLQAELDGIARDIDGRFPGSNAGWRLRATGLKASILGPVVPRMVWLQFGVVGLFGLLACVNVAGLMLARYAARRQEFSVRAAIGASRGRLIRQLLTESALLAGAGALGGLVLSGVALAAIRRVGPAFVPRLASAHIDGLVLGFTALLTVVAIVAITLAPVLAPSRIALREALQSGNRTASSRSRARGILVAAQTAIAVTLLISAALLFESFLKLNTVDPGFEPEHVLAVHPLLDGVNWSDARLVAFFGDVSARVARLPGVETVGATNVMPFGEWSTAIQYRRADRPETSDLLQANWRTVTPAFFHAMGVRLLRGRFFDERDTAAAPDVVVIADLLARRTWPGENPLGKQVVWGRTGRPKTVVGVVTDLRDRALDRDPVPTMFRPFAQLTLAAMTLVVRTTGDPAALAAQARGVVQAAAPGVVAETEPLADAVARVLLRPRVNLWMLAAFAGLAIVQAAVGLYGLLSYGVRLRHREIAIRLALGARSGALAWTVLRQALVCVLAGGLAGIAAGVAFSNLLSALLYQTSPHDVVAYAAVLGVLAAVAVVASLAPMRRALVIDPVSVLRQE